MIYSVQHKITQGNGEKSLAKAHRNTVETGEAGMKVWMQSWSSCASDHPGLVLLLLISMFILILLFLFFFLRFLRCSWCSWWLVEMLAKKVVWWWLMDGSEMDGNGMGDGCGMVVWCLLWNFSSCGGGVTWDEGEVKLPSLSCTWCSLLFHLFAFCGFFISKLISSLLSGSNSFELLLISI